MSDLLSSLKRFLVELKRRKVYRVAAAYVAAAFVGLEALDLLIPLTALPAWTSSFFLAVAVLGFPIALVLAWAFEMTPEGVKVTAPGDGVSPSVGSGGVLAGVTVLVLAAAAFWWHAGGPGPDTGVAPGERTSLAVLPFTAFGPEVEHLRDGMVGLLSTALDGAGAFHAIDQRTVLSRWQGALAVADEPDRRAALEVARAVGAEWAVLGSVTSAGERARFVARVVRAGDGELVGEATVEGHTDSLLVAVDRLTREILALMVQENPEDVSTVPMASLTTGSVPALKSFLEGERHYRDGRLEPALAAYERAVAEDSTFALAHLRRGMVSGWVAAGSMRWASVEAAYRHRARLPERARLLVVGVHLFGQSDPRGVDTLEYGTRRYPDDPELWSWRGISYFFGRACGGPEEAESAFTRTLELTPDFAPYWVHPFTLAISFHRDSALAASRIEAMGRSVEGTGMHGYVRARRVPGERVDPNQDPWIRLAFGTGSVTERVDEFLSAAERGDVRVGLTGVRVMTDHPSWWALRDTLYRRALAREVQPLAGTAQRSIVTNALRAGRIRRALEALRTMNLPVTGLEQQHALYEIVLQRSVGVPVPDSVIRRHLEWVQDSEIRGLFDLIARSMAAVELDAPEMGPDVEEVLARMAEASGRDPERFASAHRAIRAYRLWHAGEEEAALELLERGIPAWLPAQLWRAILYQRVGRLEEAARCFRAEWGHAIAYAHLGDVYAEMGRSEEAVDAYRTFLDVWEGADPEVQGLVDQVQERMAELIPSPSTRPGSSRTLRSSG